MLRIHDVTCLSSRWACVLGLLVLATVGCSDAGGNVGAGGTGGPGGTAGGGGGEGGTGGANLCQGFPCNDGNDCTTDTCNPEDGTCSYAPVDDGAICEAGACQGGECKPIASRFPCTEQGIRDGIATGGGPHAFACNGPTTVTTQAEIVIDNEVILDGEGNLTVDGNDSHPVFSVTRDVTAELRRFVVTRGKGGGIVNGGTLTLMNSAVSENTASSSGFDVGGIMNQGGTMTIANSTVSGNAASSSGLSVGGIMNVGTMTIANSTVSGNTAFCESLQQCVGIGGIANFQPEFTSTTLTITNSTVSSNTGIPVGGIFEASGATITITNTVVDGDCLGMDGATSNGNNIESPGDTCGFIRPTDQANITEEQLSLGPLADNGGPTQTHALLGGSVAIDVIPEAMCQLAADQRGVARPQGPTCDVGAFEWVNRWE